MGFQNMSFSDLSAHHSPIHAHTQDILNTMKKAAGEAQEQPPRLDRTEADKPADQAPPKLERVEASEKAEDTPPKLTRFQNSSFVDVKSVIAEAKMAEAREEPEPISEAELKVRTRQVEQAHEDVLKARMRLDDAIERGSGVAMAQSQLMQAMQREAKIQENLADKGVTVQPSGIGRTGEESIDVKYARHNLVKAIKDGNSVAVKYAKEALAEAKAKDIEAKEMGKK